MMTLLADEVGADGTQALAYANGRRQSGRPAKMIVAHHAKDGNSVRLCMSGRIESAVDEDYIAHYHATDFRFRRALMAPPWMVYDDGFFISESERQRSPFHSEFLKKNTIARP